MQQFFDLLFPDPDGRSIVVWWLPEKAAAFASTTAEAADYASRRSSFGHDVYFGLGLLGKPPASGRGSEADVTALTCLYADLDVDDGEVKRGKAGALPRGFGAVREMLNSIGLKPSVVVHSGHGLQAYWLFDAMLEIETDADREDAKKLTRGWNRTLQAVAHDHGFTIDAVHDLARVFRVPGTTNSKGATPRPCRMEYPEPGDPVLRYSVDTFDRFIVPEWLTAAPKRKADPTYVSPVIPRRTEAIPAIVAAMLENDPTFKATWEYRRKEFPSASEYDLAIASKLVACEASDQVIADAISIFRARHGLDPAKAQRRDYLMRTLSLARSGQAQQAALQEIVDQALGHEPDAAPAEPQAAQVIDAKTGAKVPAAGRPNPLANISRALGITVVEIIQHGREEAIYTLIVAGKSDARIDVTIGGIEAVLSQDRFRARVAEACKIVMGSFKKAQWHALAQTMLQAATLLENPDATRSGTMGAMLLRYFTNSSAIHSEAIWRDALRTHDPFVRTDDAKAGMEIFFHFDTFRQFIQADLGERFEKAKLHDALRLLGFRAGAQHSRIDGKVQTRTYWRGPVRAVPGLESELERLVTAEDHARVECRCAPNFME